MRTDIKSYCALKETDRQMNNCSEKQNMPHKISLTHSTHTRYCTLCTTKWKFSSSHQVPASACVFVGGRCVTCTGVIVDRCPLKPLCRTDSCLVCTPVAGGATVCVQPNLPLSISLSLPTFFLLSISFILPLPSSPTFLFDWYKSLLFRTNHHPLLKQHTR